MYEAIKQFLKPPSEGGAYTDERLAMLLAHAEDGKLSFWSCCCLLGVANAPHALIGKSMMSIAGYSHESLLRDAMPIATDAEDEFIEMGDDTDRRAKLIPLIREEMERRNSLSTQNVGSEVLALT